jgi:hypothetical protein
MVAKTRSSRCGEQLQGIDQALDVVRTPREAFGVAEDDAEVFGGPAEYGEIGDVLGDENSLVQCGHGEQVVIPQPSEHRELLDGNSVDPAFAQFLGGGWRVHLV